MDSHSRGDVVQDMCGQLVKEEAGRVVYKNYSFGVKIIPRQNPLRTQQ
jgi:hypothetical protein